ncbi:glycosyltransferase like family 2-domain-containing protein [Scenedesmus sp. NREL 46B-D3]|nr:glycosyltransferase like family 2-domain-containing protein [Scenedesmus sp. NREL 46B-D3]
MPKHRLEQHEHYGKAPLPLQTVKEPIFALNERKPPRPEPVIVKRWSWSGLAIFLYFIAAAVYYFLIRATRTLNIGYTSYGQLVLAIEIISATATLSYGILLTRYTQPKAVKGLPIADDSTPLDANDIQFRVHVLICCYGEDDAVVGNTVEKTLLAKLPARTKRTIYLCDDKGEQSKADIVKKLSAAYSDSRTDLRYITGRVRVADGRTAREVNGRVREVNGKSNNLNNCLKNVIYPGFTDPKTQTIPDNEIMMVLDADQAPVESFFCRVLEVMADQDIALCLTPQNFDDVKASYDIFNCLNLSFWEYMLPGTDAVEYVACTGTNFGLRCDALFKCNWFPSWSVTEDYTLGMNLKAKGYKARYLNEYLVFGTSPETVRKVFQQRSRWCKGQMQVLFSRECPLLDTGLTWDMRLLYTSVTWSYITNMLAVPCSVLVPFVALVFGVYPLVLNRDFALAATLYYTSSTMVTMYARRWDHLKPVWFCIVSCHLLWFTFTKAVFNVAIIAPLTGKMLGFKVTGAKNAASAATAAAAGNAQGKEGRAAAAASRS